MGNMWYVDMFTTSGMFWRTICMFGVYMFWQQVRCSDWQYGLGFLSFWQQVRCSDWQCVCVYMLLWQVIQFYFHETWYRMFKLHWNMCWLTKHVWCGAFGSKNRIVNDLKTWFGVVRSRTQAEYGGCKGRPSWELTWPYRAEWQCNWGCIGRRTVGFGWMDKLEGIE